MAQLLKREFALDDADVYRVAGPVNLVRFMQLPDIVARPDLKFPLFHPALPAEIRKANIRNTDIFRTIAKRDILVHHPYQSFMPVLDFLHAAATDPDVVAIKQTIYRTGSDSALMQSLLLAAKSGKEVTAVVELMARFDEETNINWASQLEEIGAHVVYGVVGHKTHAKMVLVVRREVTADGSRVLKRYAHLGTGNYHSGTARLYTDFGLFTTNEEMTSDVHEVFQQLTGLGSAKKMKRIWQAPFSLHANTMAAIRHEAAIAASGKPARIMARMNSLLEPEVIRELYAASAAGVKIDLIVRGVCTLRPGVKGLSENITVRSIVGRFLEHSRIYLLPQRRRGRRLPVERRLDGPQLLPAHRGRVPGPRSEAAPPRDRRRAARAPARQRARLGDGQRRRVSPQAASQGALLRSAVAAGEGDGGMTRASPSR